MHLFKIPLIAILMAITSGASVIAHEGHAHGDEPPLPNVQMAPRVTAASTLFELVAVASDNNLTIYLDRFETNEKVAGAIVEVETPSGPVNAIADADIYRLDAPWIGKAGDYELLFTVSAGADIDFLTGTLKIPAAPTETIQQGGAIGFLNSIFTQDLMEGGLANIVQKLRVNGLAILAVVMVGFLAGLIVIALVQRKRVFMGIGLTILLLVLGSSLAMAEITVRSGPSVMRDNSQRLADGRVFVPKAAQRIFAIRTVVATEGTHRRSLELPGRVIPDPNASGFVQTTISGRLSAPPGGFVPLGSRVEAGQVLAIVVPSLSVIDKSSLQQARAELDQEIAILVGQVERFSKLSGSGSVSATQLEETKITLAGLRERRALLDKMQFVSEELVAPISGVIASAKASPGLIAESNTVVFHIVDPQRLWIEALSYGREIIGRSASVADAAGSYIPLSFAGAGFADGSPAQRIHFAINDTQGRMRLGQMATVVAETETSTKGIAVPRDAVVRGSNGEDIVYVHTEPEVFVSRSVRTEPLDATRVLIVAGVVPDDRLVTQGAELLNQLR